MESITRAYLGLLELEEEEADEEEVLLAAAVLATSKRRRRRRHWVEPINQRRPQYGILALNGRYDLIFLRRKAVVLCV